MGFIIKARDKENDHITTQNILYNIDFEISNKIEFSLRKYYNS